MLLITVQALLLHVNNFYHRRLYPSIYYLIDRLNRYTYKYIEYIDVHVYINISTGIIKAHFSIF